MDIQSFDLWIKKQEDDSLTYPGVNSKGAHLTCPLARCFGLQIGNLYWSLEGEEASRRQPLPHWAYVFRERLDHLSYPPSRAVRCTMTVAKRAWEKTKKELKINV